MSCLFKPMIVTNKTHSIYILGSMQIKSTWIPPGMKRLRIQKQIQGPVGRIFKGRNTTDRQEGLHEVIVLVDSDGSRDKAGVEHCHRVYILESDRVLFSGKPFSHTNYTQH